MRIPQFEPDEIIATSIKESARDFVIGSGEYVIKDFKFTIKQAEKRFDKMKKNIKFRQSQDDNWVSSSTPERIIRGIDDSLISGSASDSGIGKRRGRDASSAGGVDSWEGTEQTPDGFAIWGRRWEIKKSLDIILDEADDGAAANELGAMDRCREMIPQGNDTAGNSRVRLFNPGTRKCSNLWHSGILLGHGAWSLYQRTTWAEQANRMKLIGNKLKQAVCIDSIFLSRHLLSYDSGSTFFTAAHFISTLKPSGSMVMYWASFSASIVDSNKCAKSANGWFLLLLDGWLPLLLDGWLPLQLDGGSVGSLVERSSFKKAITLRP
ncbi:LOW QUALITY PROTEIN: hypothetical protein U9M48_030849 [Paspalum notatum var. saurae]|uniref:Uncharacterized protein n=1 Tax=Paspalum notatum var. saurae TaxID=547442 RepID=A0AAQ3U1B0_PASNO